jgi:hypothetical protein
MLDGKKRKTIGELNNSDILRKKSMNYIKLRGEEV